MDDCSSFPFRVVSYDLFVSEEIDKFEKANVKISHIENNGDVYLDKDYDENIDIMNSIDVNLK